MESSVIFRKKNIFVNQPLACQLVELPASSTTQDTATLWIPQAVAVFLCLSGCCGVLKVAPINASSS